jgi:hypothetical protein
MRNDARPIGEDSPASPLGGDHTPDDRESVTHDRQSHVVNKVAEDDARREDHDIEPTMPTGDSTLNTKI